MLFVFPTTTSVKNVELEDAFAGSPMIRKQDESNLVKNYLTQNQSGMRLIYMWE